MVLGSAVDAPTILPPVGLDVIMGWLDVNEDCLTPKGHEYRRKYGLDSEQEMGAVEMNAKFDGQCIRCSGTVRRGQKIFWKREVGAWHESCPTRDPSDAGI